MNQLDKMMAWEDGTLDREGTITLFQSLVDSGMAWTLQGMYGRTAMALIQAGLVHVTHNLVARKFNPYERVEGIGEALTLDSLIHRLEGLRDRGNLPVHLRNYLEENVLAPITDVSIDGSMIVLESLDGDVVDNLDAGKEN